MNLLFDLISAQGTFFNGAAGYTRKLYLEILKAIQSSSDIRLLLICDSRIPYIYNDMSIQYLSQNKSLTVIDIAKYQKVSSIIEEFEIDRFFICLAQLWNNYNLDGVNCEVYCTIHDMVHSECERSHIREFAYIDNHTYLIKKWIKSKITDRGSVSNRYKALFNFIRSSKNLKIVTVSDYSKKSIIFYLNISNSDIIVSWSPEKEVTRNLEIENDYLRQVINQNKKYYLIVSADRPLKNAKKLLSAFHRYIEITGDESVIMTIGMKQQLIKEQIALPYLSESDLENAYANCFALIYGSLMEGFGYPPIEAMKYSKPVLASNVCSIPEVLGDAPVYFSPFYETDIYKALISLSDESCYKLRMEKSQDRYHFIRKKQVEDMRKLVNIIINNTLE